MQALGNDLTVAGLHFVGEEEEQRKLVGIISRVHEDAALAEQIGVPLQQDVAEGEHDRVAGICVLASLLMAALGGCWWPLEIGPPVMKTIALCLPTGWALEALHQLISFGSGFDAVLKPIGVLLAFGAAANLLAARFFRS